MLTIKNLTVTTSGKQVLNGVSLTIKSGEVHALMGPNGAGKTSLAMALMGSPTYAIANSKFSRNLRDPAAAGQISNFKFQINGKDVGKLKPEERARRGLFVAFQQPIEVTGVSVLAFLRMAYKALHPKDTIPLSEFKKQVADALAKVHLEETFIQRYLNEGFSGGEKKRAEVVQLLVLRPKFAILDEIDSGLDIDSLKVVAQALKKTAEEHKMGMLLITHYQRILHHLKPDYVHVLVNGKLVASDGMRLVTRIERRGYVDLTIENRG